MHVPLIKYALYEISLLKREIENIFLFGGVVKNSHPGNSPRLVRPNVYLVTKMSTEKPSTFRN